MPAPPPVAQTAYDLVRSASPRLVDRVRSFVGMWFDTSFGAAGGLRPVSAEYPFPVSVIAASAARPTTITYAAPSGSTTITLGGTAQVLTAAGEIVNTLLVVNPTGATEVLYVDPVTTASPTGATSIPIPAGGSQAFGAATGAVSVYAATTGHKFVALRG